MIKPITNARAEAPSVIPDTLPLMRYSWIMSKKEPKRMATNGRKNLPRGCMFRFGWVVSGNLLIVL
jgi:hypothetical protein